MIVLAEQRGPTTPKEIESQEVFWSRVKDAGDHLITLGVDEGELFPPFIRALATNGIVVLSGNERYYREMRKAEEGATRRPFGIEMSTLSPYMQLALYPAMVYQPTAGFIQDIGRLDYEPRDEGPQALLYVLDGYERQRSGKIEDFTANLYFIGHMTQALLERRYPFDTGERSPEFKQEVKAALDYVREYLNRYLNSIASRPHSLSDRIARLAELDEVELFQEAQNFVLYQTEPIKRPGLAEPGRDDAEELTPEEAIQTGQGYLHCTERNLPLRPPDALDAPSLPWVEFTTNRFNRKRQLFGRYQIAIEEGQTLTVDYVLDTTFIPNKYGFFHMLEIMIMNNKDKTTIEQHIIIGQELNPLGSSSTSPIAIAGGFDFTDPRIRNCLEKLAQDIGTKHQISAVLTAILNFN